MGIRIRQQDIGEDGMKVEVSEERVIGGVVIRPFYGPRPLGIRPMQFTKLLTCDYLIPIPTISRQLQQ